jgi:hypothetical protein
MNVSEIAEMLSPYGNREYSLFEYLNTTDYGTSTIAQTPLPKAVQALCASTAADVRWAEFILPDKFNEDVAARFGDFRDRVQEVLAPIDAVNPIYMEGVPGMGKTTIGKAMVRTIADRTDGRIAYFHVNGPQDVRPGMLSKKVGVTSVRDEIHRLGDFGLLHPATRDFAYGVHPNNANIMRYEDPEALPPKDFDTFVRLLQANDRYPAPSDRAEWPKQIWDVPVLTPMGAMLLGRFELGPDNRPVQRDNCSVMMFLDEFNQIEPDNQKLASTVVGAFCGEVARTGNPLGFGHRSGWVQSLIDAGAYNRHRILVAAGNNQGLSGADADMMDALMSRLGPHTITLPKNFSNLAYKAVISQQLVKGVVDKATGFSPTSVRAFLATPDQHEVKSQFLKHSKAQVEELVGNAVAFEAVVRQGLTARSTSGGGNGEALPEDMAPRIEYLSKYTEAFDMGNALTLRDGVNLVGKFVRMKFDSRAGVNALRIKRMILGSFASEPAANRFPDNQTYNDWMKKRLEPSARSMGDVVDQFVNTFPIDALLSEKEKARKISTPAREVAKRLLVSISPAQTNEADAKLFFEKWKEVSEKIADQDPPHATAIYKLSPPESMSAFLVTFDAADHTLPHEASPAVLKTLKELPSTRTKVRQLNSQIASFQLLHARMNDMPPTQSLSIPQIVDGENDQYKIGYQVLRRQGTDGSLLEESLVTVRPNMNINMSKLSINLSAAMTRHDVLSLGELMAHPEAVTDDVAGPASAKRRTLRGSLFTVQEPPKAASAILIR